MAGSTAERPLLPVQERRVGSSPRVSVLTPSRLAPDRAALLTDLHDDLAAAEVDWEWIIVVDGAHRRSVPAQVTADPRVRVLRAGRAVGAAAARNLGLGIAAGSYVTAVDDDDHLPPASLERRLHAARRYGVAWVAGMLADLRDGITTVWDCPMPRGPAAPGDVWRAWACPCMPFPIGPSTLLVETNLLRSVGGWQGLPQAEDLGMTLAVTARADGVVLDELVYTYRKHAGQMTTGPGFDDLEPLVRHITFERGRLATGSARTSSSQAAWTKYHPAPAC